VEYAPLFNPPLPRPDGQELLYVSYTKVNTPLAIFLAKSTEIRIIEKTYLLYIWGGMR
jgi:hypothetical protein